MKVRTVGDLKRMVSSLPDDTPVGKYFPRYWHPYFEARAMDVEFLHGEGLALDIDYSTNY